MNDFVNPNTRSISLPIGCKDLIDVVAIRNCKPDTHCKHTRFGDHLAVIERDLPRLLQPTGKFPRVVIATHYRKHLEEDRGYVSVIQGCVSEGPVVDAICKDRSQEQLVQSAFAKKRISPVLEPKRLRSKRSLTRYPLPTDIFVAAQLIGEIFRAGYGLDNRTMIALDCLYEANAV
jgi:hypothetical protein